MRIFSGIQPTGAKHLGNYAGGFRQYVATQDQQEKPGDAFFCIVDLHSISVEYDPEELRERSLDLLALLVATGLDPERSTIFAQSHVTAHAEANWLLSSVASFGELRRMTQFKDKSDAQEFVSAALFTYPVLMAGDILLYQTDVVPVGVDQRQHVELTRDVATRFNSRFGETFTVPRGIYPEIGAKVMDLQEPEKKMSTTGGTEQGTVYVLDTPDAIRRKFKTAVTDSGREVTHSPDKPGVSNLVEIMSVATDEAIADVEARYDGQGYGAFKEDVAEAVIALLDAVPGALPRAPLRSRRAPADPRARGGEGARRLGADARDHVRAHGLRQALESARSASTSAAVSSRHSPGARPPSSSPAYRTRCSRSTGAPPRSHMRFTWCLRPSCRVSSRTDERSPVLRTLAAAGAVIPSSSSTPSRSAARASSSGVPSTSAS